jgi:hypothetical protein
MAGWSSTGALMIWRVPTVWESNATVDLCIVPSYFLWLSVHLKGCTKQGTIGSQSLFEASEECPVSFQCGIWRVPNLVANWSPISAMWSEECPLFDWESNLDSHSRIYLQSIQKSPYFTWYRMDLKSGQTVLMAVTVRHLKSGRCFQGGSEEWLM